MHVHRKSMGGRGFDVKRLVIFLVSQVPTAQIEEEIRLPTSPCMHPRGENVGMHLGLWVTSLNDR